MIRALVDTGPLVAILQRRDSWHERCTEAARKIQPPMLTCWPVISEAFWLVRHEPRSLDRLLHWQQEGILRILDLPADSLPWIAAFEKRYADVHPDLADAALMYLADRERIDTLFTLDRRDFTIYRLPRNRQLRLVPI